MWTAGVSSQGAQHVVETHPVQVELVLEALLGVPPTAPAFFPLNHQSGCPSSWLKRAREGRPHGVKERNETDNRQRDRQIEEEP